MATPAPSAKPSASPLSVWPLPAALVDRGTSGILHREGRQRPATRLSLYIEDEPQPQLSTKRLSRDEAFLIVVHCQAAAKRAAADSEGHSEAAKFGQSG
jgi:hypothetical protein